LCEQFRIWRLFVIKLLNLGSDWVLFHIGVVHSHFDNRRIDERLIGWNKVRIPWLEAKHIAGVENSVAWGFVRSLIKRSEKVFPTLLFNVVSYIAEKWSLFIICISIQNGCCFKLYSSGCICLIYILAELKSNPVRSVAYKIIVIHIICGYCTCFIQCCCFSCPDSVSNCIIGSYSSSDLAL